MRPANEQKPKVERPVGESEARADEEVMACCERLHHMQSKVVYLAETVLHLSKLTQSMLEELSEYECNKVKLCGLFRCKNA